LLESVLIIIIIQLACRTP